MSGIPFKIKRSLAVSPRHRRLPLSDVIGEAFNGGGLLEAKGAPLGSFLSRNFVGISDLLLVTFKGLTVLFLRNKWLDKSSGSTVQARR